MHALSRETKPQRRRPGFTIVELLIVIVVIAILAAISIVAYVGVQERANVTAKISAARQALSLLRGYQALNGELPYLENRAVCIGEGWITLPDGRRACWDIMEDGSIAGSTFFVDDEINTELGKLGTLPSYPQKPSWSGDHATLDKPMIHNGLALYHRTEEMPEYYRPGYSLIYILPPGEKCRIGGAIRTEMAEGATRCVIWLGKE